MEGEVVGVGVVGVEGEVVVVFLELFVYLGEEVVVAVERFFYSLGLGLEVATGY